MKSKKLLIALLVLLIPIMPKAAATYTLSCDKTEVSSTKEATCSIRIDPDTYNVSKVHIELSSDSKLTIFSHSLASDITGTASNNFDAVVGGKNNEFDLMTFKVKATDSTKHSVNKITVTNLQLFEHVDTEDVAIATLPSQSKDITILSSDNTLSSLTLSKGTFTFNKATTEYTVDINNTQTLSVTANAKEEQTVVTIKTIQSNKGNIDGSPAPGQIVTMQANFKDEETKKIEVTATSEDGTTTKYTITINNRRIETRPLSTENTLKSLSFGDLKFNETFQSNKTTYYINIDSNNTGDLKYTISAAVTSANSTFVKNYGPREVKVEFGTNTYEIKVQPEKGTPIQVYKIIVTRRDIRDTNANLTSISLSDGKLTFDQNKTLYTVNVVYETSTLTINATPASTKAKVEYPQSVSLNEGSNKIKIKVTAENGTIKEYEITVNRLAPGISVEDVEKIKYIKTLTITNKIINFNPNTLTYNIEITNETSLEFNYDIYENVNGTIIVDGTYKVQVSGTSSVLVSPIKDGSTIELELITPDGYSKKYQFNIKVRADYVGETDVPSELAEFEWTWQAIVGVCCAFLIIVELVFFVIIIIRDDTKKEINEYVQMKK